jgi:hypothetical protein
MTNQHPITPPPELLQQWATEYWGNPGESIGCGEKYIATKAAQWGADQELEACCEWFQEFYKTESWVDLDLRTFRAARRPKPPTLKEQALRVLVENGTNLDGRMELDSADIEIISRALEALPND